jgi:hypothetical protein
MFVVRICAVIARINDQFCLRANAVLGWNFEVIAAASR